MQYNLGGEIHVARSQRTLCSHTRGGAEGWCVRLDAENDMLLFTSRHAENDMLKTGRFLSRLRKIRFSHREISDLVRGCCVAPPLFLPTSKTLYHPPKYSRHALSARACVADVPAYLGAVVSCLECVLEAC